MADKKKKKQRAREEPKKTISWLCSQDAFEMLTCQGYTSLSHNPEIISGVDTIAKLVGSMTLHLMKNTEKGDVRVVNELSRKIDINPSKNLTRSTFIQWIIRTLYLDGDGNALVYPKTRGGYIQDLMPMPPGMVNMIPDGIWDYTVAFGGREYRPDQVLHFILSPGTYYPWKGEGLRVPLSDVAGNLKQAAATEKGFMKSKWKPSLIIKIDSLNESFSSPQGRRKILENYIDTTEAGEPWVIPAEQIGVEQVKPLSLSDLALPDMVKLDKQTVASVLRVPPFLLGVGSFKRDEWNNFISSTIKPLADMIQQELTKKLLYSPDLYFRFNARSLYSYELRDLAAIADDQYVRGIMTRDEVRDWINMPPIENEDDLIILENYIPAGMIGDQKKLIQDGGESN